MKKSVRNVIIPIDGNHFQKRMNALPTRNCEKHIVRIFATVENIQAVKIEIDDVDFSVIRPKLVTKTVNTAAPPAAHEQEIFAVKVGDFEPALRRQPMMDGNGAAERLKRKRKPRTAVKSEHRLVENSSDNINVFSEIPKNFAGIFGRAFERDEILCRGKGR